MKKNYPREEDMKCPICNGKGRHNRICNRVPNSRNSINSITNKAKKKNKNKNK